MIWTVTAIVTGLVALIAATALTLFARRGRSRNGGPAPMASGDPYGGFYGLSPEETARFHRSAREHMRLHHAQWSRDYLPAAGGGGLPGRVAGIPRALRVRR